MECAVKTLVFDAAVSGRAAPSMSSSASIIQRNSRVYHEDMLGSDSGRTAEKAQDLDMQQENDPKHTKKDQEKNG